MPLVSGGEKPKTMVLWDIEDCPVPESLDVYTAWKNISSTLYAKGYVQGRFEAIGFGDIFEIDSCFSHAGIYISHVTKGARDDRRNFILVKLLIEAIRADFESNFVLLVGDISGHSGFLRALEYLKSRTCNHVVLVQPGDEVSLKLDGVVTAAWLWSSLSARGDSFFHQTRTPRPICEEDGHFITANTAIFWDVEDCQIPDGLNADVVLRNIKSALANRGIISSMDEVVPVYAYYGGATSSMNHFSHDSVHNLCPTGLDKGARLEKILVDSLCCLIDKPDTTNLLLILGEISEHMEFMFAANLLRNINFNVLLAQPHIASQDMKFWPSKIWLWSSLSVGGHPFC